MAFNDIMNIQGEQIPEIDAALDKLLEEGKTKKTQVLEGVSDRRFAGRQPYAKTSVSMTFKDEENLRKCVRMLRWSDERLAAMGSSIEWAWMQSYRLGMNIKFAVSWYDKEFYEQRKTAVTDANHLSYFRMFGMAPSDMDIQTQVLSPTKPKK